MKIFWQFNFKSQTFWKFSENLKIFQKSENFPKIWKFSKNLNHFLKKKVTNTLKQEWFLAVQNSSIGLIVCPLLALTKLTIKAFTTLQSDPRDLWPLRHLIRVMRRHDLTKKDLPTYLPTSLENTIQELVCQWHFHFSCMWAAVLFYTFDIYRSYALDQTDFCPSFFTLIFDPHYWPSFLTLIFDPHFWSPFLTLIFYPNFWPSFLTLIFDP